MQKHDTTYTDFDKPPLFFILEEKFKNIGGGSLYYQADIKSLDLKGSENILDFGCGGGATVRAIAQHLNDTGHILGVDISVYWIKIAQQRLAKYPNVELKTGDIRTMNLPEHSFDIVITLNVLHHIAWEERPAVVKILSRLLKKDGRLYLGERLQASHGIPVKELRSLISNAGLTEKTFQMTKSKYRGIFVVK
ncbi:MAG: class I SAM-dependent methyltransferase [Dehalococcoidales bacterium]